MKRLFLVPAAFGLILAGITGQAEAGCIKGAIVGGIAGHFLGHGGIGAAAGCAYGASRNRRQDRFGHHRDRDGTYSENRDVRQNSY